MFRLLLTLSPLLLISQTQADCDYHSLTSSEEFIGDSESVESESGGKQIGSFVSYTNEFSTGPVYLLSRKIIRITNFTFEGPEPKVVFNVKQHDSSDSYNQPQSRAPLKYAKSDNPIIKNPDGKCERIGHYTNEPKLILTLPSTLTLDQVNYIALYSLTFHKTIGYINIPYNVAITLMPTCMDDYGGEFCAEGDFTTTTTESEIQDPADVPYNQRLDTYQGFPQQQGVHLILPYPGMSSQGRQPSSNTITRPMPSSAVYADYLPREPQHMSYGSPTPISADELTQVYNNIYYQIYRLHSEVANLHQYDIVNLNNALTHLLYKIQLYSNRNLVSSLFIGRIPAQISSIRNKLTQVKQQLESLKSTVQITTGRLAITYFGSGPRSELMTLNTKLAHMSEKLVSIFYTVDRLEQKSSNFVRILNQSQPGSGSIAYDTMKDQTTSILETTQIVWTQLGTRTGLYSDADSILGQLGALHNSVTYFIYISYNRGTWNSGYRYPPY